MTVPPRKSTPRFNPLVERKNTAARNMANEMTLNTSACRMNGMSRVKRKNSMVTRAPRRGFCHPEAREGPAFAGSPSRLRRHGRPRRAPHLADRNLFELLSTAVDQRNNAARPEHRREHRRQDAQNVHDREAAHGSG